ncbi:MAG: TetR/AcrR family transcriptional regulator [Actinomycetota bacterium]
MTAIESQDLLKGAKEGAPHTSKRIQDAALRLFYERGYRSTTMREIALACGLTPGALYNHFSSKDELLGSIMIDIHKELEATTEEAVEVADGDLVTRLRAFLRAHGVFHTDHITEARVANREVASLTGDAYEEVVRIRKKVTRQLRDILARGRDKGLFEVANVEAVSYLMLTMGISIANWFRPDGELSREQMADLHAEMAIRMVLVQGREGGR